MNTNTHRNVIAASLFAVVVPTLFAVLAVSASQGTAPDSMVLPQTVEKPMTFTALTCPSGYEGHYLDVSQNFPEYSGGNGVWYSSGSVTSNVRETYPVCVSTRLVKELREKAKATK